MPGSVSRYALVGMLGTATHLALLYGLVEWAALPPLLATSLAFCWVVLQSYWLNRNWVFQSDSRHVSSLPKFVIASLLGLTANFGLMYLMIEVLDLWYMAAQIVTILVIPPMNYLLYRYWTFASP